VFGVLLVVARRVDAPADVELIVEMRGALPL